MVHLGESDLPGWVTEGKPWTPLGKRKPMPYSVRTLINPGVTRAVVERSIGLEPITGKRETGSLIPSFIRSEDPDTPNRGNAAGENRHIPGKTGSRPGAMPHGMTRLRLA